jgi:Uncharacterised nucleotidyltransferase
MNRALAEAIVRVLSVRGPAENRLEALRRFDITDWHRTLSWLDDSALALYLLEAVGHAGRDDALPVAIHARLTDNLQANRERVAAMKPEFQRLNRHLDAAGVEYAVLKGFALIPSYCPDAALRSQYDYDYLVSAATLDRAQSALEELGYLRKVQSPGHEPEGVSLLAARGANPAWHGDSYTQALTRGIELHTKLWEYSADGVDVGAPPDALARKHSATWAGLQFPTLCNPDALLFQILHAFHHLLDHWCRLSCFLEIARFLNHRRFDNGFWEQFRERVHRLRHVPEITGLVFAMSRLLFDAPVPEDVGRWAPAPPVLALWVEHYGFTWALAPFPGSKLSLFVHREFVDDARTWRAIRRARLFPWHRPAQVVESLKQEDATRVANWKARAEQWRFVAGRARFHLGALLEFGRHVASWKSMVRQEARSSAVQSGFSSGP